MINPEKTDVNVNDSSQQCLSCFWVQLQESSETHQSKHSRLSANEFITILICFIATVSDLNLYRTRYKQPEPYTHDTWE